MLKLNLKQLLTLASARNAIERRITHKIDISSYSRALSSYKKYNNVNEEKSQDPDYLFKLKNSHRNRDSDHVSVGKLPSEDHDGSSKNHNFARHNNNKFAGLLQKDEHESASNIDLAGRLTMDNLKNVGGEDRDYLVRLRNDPDTFGEGPVRDDIYDEGDLKEEEFLSNPPDPGRRLSTKQYADIIKDLIKHRKIKEAIDVIEVRMLKDDKVKPENYIYNLVLGGCGRVGYTKKAFSLYNDMKRRGLEIHPGTYTALFNACANSPWPADGLSRAKHLHEIMIEKRYEPNDTNYHSMIKAYGRCGDLQSAFAIVDEMVAKKFVIKDETLIFLLQACISDKEAGYRHALLVWRKYIDKKIAPSLYSYNLMLRCIRDCNLGDLEVTREVIGKILPETDKFLLLKSGTIENNDNIGPAPEKREDRNYMNIEELENEPVSSDINTKVSSIEKTPYCKQPVNEITINRPNLMAPVPHLGDIITLSEVKRPEDRLLLVGGAKGFLQSMQANKCKPDIITFSQLLDCVANSFAAEKDLMVAMRQGNVKPDIDFYNALIKRRSMRVDYEAGKEVLEIMKQRNFRPNLMTYGVLALGCKNKEEAHALIQEMQDANYRMNMAIMGAMLQQACYHHNFGYVLELMELCLKEEISPNKKFMEHLEKFKKTCKEAANDKEKPKTYLKGYQVFRLRYKTWLTQVHVEEDEHPWKQFRETTDTDVRHYKDESARFKARHTSLFRQKTSPRHFEGPPTKNIPRKQFKNTKRNPKKTEVLE